MIPETDYNGPVFDGTYRPYFYQSGKFLLYDPSHQTEPKGYLESTASGYDFTSDLTSKRPVAGPQTVEDIIRNGYLSVPHCDPETALISDKQAVSRLGLSDIISQIKSRYEIYNDVIYNIEMSKCYTVSSQLAVESSRGGVRMSSREAYSLNKKISEFYLQQNEERVRLWQDVSRLKQLLPEQAQSYLSGYRKMAILSDTKGELE
jgi:hypothetical protein